MIGEALRLIRVFHDVKLNELAEQLDVSKGYISEIESQKKKPSLDLIEKYSIKLYECNSNTYGDETYLLLRKDFDDLISEMQKIKISKNYLGLFSWLIDRGFIITHNIKSTQFQLKSTINKNRAILLKVLYTINPSNLLKCFSKNY